MRKESLKVIRFYNLSVRKETFGFLTNSLFLTEIAFLVLAFLTNLTWFKGMAISCFIVVTVMMFLNLGIDVVIYFLKNSTFQFSTNEKLYRLSPSEILEVLREDEVIHIEVLGALKNVEYLIEYENGRYETAVKSHLEMWASKSKAEYMELFEKSFLTNNKAIMSEYIEKQRSFRDELYKLVDNIPDLKTILESHYLLVEHGLEFLDNGISVRT